MCIGPIMRARDEVDTSVIGGNMDDNEQVTGLTSGARVKEAIPKKGTVRITAICKNCGERIDSRSAEPWRHRNTFRKDCR